MSAKFPHTIKCDKLNEETPGLGDPECPRCQADHADSSVKTKRSHVTEKKVADQRVFKVGDRELFQTAVSEVDKQTELQIKLDDGRWMRVAEFDNNEAAKQFMDLIQDHIAKKTLRADFNPDSIFREIMGHGESAEVRAARGRAEAAREDAEAARYKADEARHKAELARQTARLSREKAESAASKVTQAMETAEESGLGCLSMVFLALILPPLFLYLLGLAVRHGFGG